MVDAIDTSTLLEPSVDSVGASSFADLGSEDFLRLMISELTQQDPLEPTGNEELLAQISSIREIELSTSLSESLQALTGQQRFASASTMIGHYVTAVPGSDGAAIGGIVVGVRFDADGAAMLQLSNGTEISLDQVSTIEPPLSVGEALVGQTVIGVDRRDPQESEVLEGVVTAARIDDQGEVLLELDGGDELRLRDFVSIAALDG
ncbi:MAG: hypothetical protein JSU63_01020 [Phycisphaerales bacterium]|nr:MAG: hypothetical protein JSU63_01020 [Phycisphaerales bacterium]